MTDAINFEALENASPTKAEAPTIDFAALESEAKPAPSASSGPTGVVANLGAGLNEGMAGVFGAPVDLMTGAANLVGRGVHAMTGAAYQPIENPVGGSASIERAMGVVGANPQNVPVQSGPEGVARSVGQGVGSMVAPGIGSEALLATKAGQALGPVATGALESLRGSPDAPATLGATATTAAKNAAIGAGAGAGQYVGETVAPDGYKPLGGFIGSLVGGLVPGAGEAAFQKALADRSVQRSAADTVLGAATDPAALKSWAGTAAEPLVPGSEPTAAEALNDPGLLQTQNWAQTRNQVPFDQRRATNNAARVEFVNSAVPEAQMTPGQIVVARLNDLDAAHQAVIDQANTAATRLRDSLGTPPAQEDIGATAGGQIAQNYAGPMSEIDQAQQAGAQQAQQAIQAAGGNRPLSGDYDTLHEQYGAQLRGYVQEADDSLAKEHAAIWARARDNGDVQMDPTPVRQAVAEAQGMIRPAGGDKLTPAEAAIHDTIGGWTGPVDPLDLMAMRTNVGDAMNTAYRGGDSRAGARLKVVRSGIDSAIEGGTNAIDAADQAAVRAGQLSPEDAFGTALAASRDQWRATGSSQRPNTGLGDSGQGATATNPARAGDVDGLPRTASQAQTGRRTAATPSSSSPEVAPAEGEVNPQGSPSERYAAARAFTRNYYGMKDDTAIGKVLERGDYGRPDATPSAKIPGLIARTGPDTTEVRNFEKFVGGRPEAVDTLKDFLAYDLKSAAVDPTTGRVNIGAHQRWMDKHRGVLSVYPDLRQSFGRMADAQQSVDKIAQDRGALEKQFLGAMGDSDATVMDKYLRPGAKGADGIDAYMHETGGTPEATKAMEDHIVGKMIRAVAQDSVVNPASYSRFAKTYEAALGRMPDLAARMKNAAGAQKVVEDALAEKNQRIQEYQKGVARFFLHTPDGDPAVGIGAALRPGLNNDPVKNARDLMALAKGDPDGEAGIRRATVDWLMSKGQSGKEAGQTDTKWLKNQTMRDLIENNKPALQVILGRNALDHLTRVADDLMVADRSISGSKAPIGPGTARDVTQQSRFGNSGQTVMSYLLKGGVKLGTTLAGAHFGGMEGAIGGLLGEDKLEKLVSSMRSARQEKVLDLVQGAMEDPAEMRALLAHATPENLESAMGRLQRRIGQAAVAGAIGTTR